MKTSHITLAGLAALALVLLPSCSEKKQQEAQDQKPVVKVQTVYQRAVDQVEEFTASVEADLVNNISSSTPNRIKQILVDEGMQVSKGQKLVVLDDVNATNYQIQLDNAKANLANVQVNYNRALELYKIGGGTKQALDQMETQLINARNAVAAAERVLANSRENTVLTSPISGMITARNYDPGDMTGQLPILTVATVNPVKIAINVTESELSRVKMGMPADVTFDTYGAEVFPGKVTMISPTIDQATRTFGVEVTLPNNDRRLLPGMFGRVKINLGTQNHVVVPDLAVLKQQGSGNHYIYVYKDGKVEFRFVELGQRLGDAYEILSGLEDGTQVVTVGQARLTDGAEVELQK